MGKTQTEIKKNKMRRVVESAKKFNLELKKSVSAAVVVAFGLITALAWKDVIEEHLTRITSLSPVQGKTISALIITIISVIAITLITKRAEEPVKEIKENEN